MLTPCLTVGCLGGSAVPGPGYEFTKAGHLVSGEVLWGKVVPTGNQIQVHPLAWQNGPRTGSEQIISHGHQDKM